MSNEDDDNVGLAFGLSIAAGLATWVGGGLVFFGVHTNKHILSAALGAASGVMLFVSFAEILGKSEDAFADAGMSDVEAMGAAYGYFFVGVALTVLMDSLSHWLDRDAIEHDVVHAVEGDAKVVPPSPFVRSIDDDDAAELRAWGSAGEGADTPTSLGTSASGLQLMMDVELGRGGGEHKKNDEVGTGDAKKLRKMSLLTACAIAFHNIPEGLATFVATLANPTSGVGLAFAIAIHNIPEGMCIAFPVYYATKSKRKGFWWAALSGVAEPFGALLGWIVLRDNFSDHAYGALFGIVGGIMVMITVSEMLPNAHRYDPKDRYVTKTVIGGMAIMALSLVLFAL